MTFLILGGVLMACSSDKNMFSPEQVISHALENSEKTKAYQAEFLMTVKEKGEVIEEGKTLEWRDENGRVRLETYDQSGELISIVVNNGEEFIIYELENEQASIIDDPELIALNQQTPKEQTEASLAIVKDTHDLTLKDETKVAGRDVKHIVATPKDKNSLIGTLELWIDKENWFVLKTINESGDFYMEVEYESIDFSAKISDDQFNVDLPPHVKLINLDEVYAGDEVSLFEATEALGSPFLYFPESEELTIASLEKTDLEGIVNRTEVDIEYVKNDLPYISLSVFETPEDVDDIAFPGEEKILLRDKEGIFIDSEGFRSVMWDEEGLRYSIIIHDPSVSIEEIEILTKEMIYTEERDD